MVSLTMWCHHIMSSGYARDSPFQSRPSTNDSDFTREGALLADTNTGLSSGTNWCVRGIGGTGVGVGGSGVGVGLGGGVDVAVTTGSGVGMWISGIGIAVDCSSVLAVGVGTAVAGTEPAATAVGTTVTAGFKAVPAGDTAVAVGSSGAAVDVGAGLVARAVIDVSTAGDAPVIGGCSAPAAAQATDAMANSATDSQRTRLNRMCPNFLAPCRYEKPRTCCHTPPSATICHPCNPQRC